MLQSQVDTHGKPCGAHDQTANLHREAIVRKRIVMKHETADVAECFDETAATESEGESPCFVCDTLIELGGEENDEEGKKEGVCWQGGEIAVD